MPKKAHTTAPTPPRRQLERTTPADYCSHTYISLKDIEKKIGNVKGLERWNPTFSDDRVTLKLFLMPALLPKFEVVIDVSLAYHVQVYGWSLLDTHQVYKEFRRSVQFTTILALVTFIQDHHICIGIYFWYLNTLRSKNLWNHLCARLGPPKSRF